MKDNIAIRVKNLSKTFVIPREKINSLRSAAITAFKKKSYEQFKALDNVSFEVKKGEFFGIIGRNGSGKSTLLKILAGIYTPDKGEVMVDGLISPFLELGIGFNPELSGRDNIYLNATVLGMSEKEVNEKFDEIVHFSELGRFIDQKLKNYSSGMNVRLAFSVSIHANREILLMDEVLAVGDSNFQAKCLEEFEKYKGMGRTVILVTHSVEVVRRYCDRALLLRNGKVAEIGNVDKVVDQYIFDNMSDEEKRLLAEEKRRAAQIAKEQEKEGKGEKEEEEKMNAEGRKKTEEEKGIQEDKERNKVAEIIGVEFLDKDKKERKVFETGETMCIRIHFLSHKIIKNFLAGFSIASNDGIVIAETNNKKRGYSFDVDVANKEYCIDFIIKEISLLQGKYLLSVFLGSSEEKMFDQKTKEYVFRISSQRLEECGIIDLRPIVSHLKK